MTILMPSWKSPRYPCAVGKALSNRESMIAVPKKRRVTETTNFPKEELELSCLTPRPYRVLPSSSPLDSGFT
jgi:hypothetical protein